ncbi:MAG: T9SS type A sorting domain-containing protein, partial [Saprospiraceae bacterium]
IGGSISSGNGGSVCAEIPMEDPNHGDTLNPFFKVIIRDSTCDIIDELCIISNVDNNEVEVSYINDDTLVYKQWTCDSFELKEYIGEKVTVEFIAADCGAGAHFGYAYIADICDNCSSMPHIAIDSIDGGGCGVPDICGNLLFGDSYDFVSLQLEVTQFGNVLLSGGDFDFDSMSGNFCFDINSSFFNGLDNECYDIFVVASLINSFGDTVKIRTTSLIPNTFEDVDNDICLPIMSCCPDSLIVIASTPEIMPVFGDSDCDEYVYYVEGKYTIPEGYVFCDSLPVFEGGYFVYDNVSYNQFPWNHVNFSGHLYVTDLAAYMSNPGLIGQFMICDDSTEAMCPAKVTIQYRAPMNGMMCNFTHCLNCIICNNSYGQNVPVKSCMTLQFPTCYDDCGINEYYLSIIKPDLLNPLVLYTDTIAWDSSGINQDYCFEYILKYYDSRYPCYQVKLETNCGQVCLSSICLNNLVPCYTINPFQQVDKPVSLIQNQLEVFPNPNNGNLVNIKAGNVTSGTAEVILYSLQGSISRMEKVLFIGQNASLNTEDLNPGTYIISVQDKVTGVKSITKYIHMD